MSTPEKTDICAPDTQETYYEESNNEKTHSETQNTNINESQDFRLVDFGEDESLIEKTQPSSEETCQKPAKEPDLQQTSDTVEPKTDNKSITASDDKIESERKIIEEETTKSDLVKKNEINDELTDNDEDEIIQGTPPHSYTPPKKADGDIEGASLKRKAGSFEEPPAKVLRTTSMEDAVDVKEKFMEEESRQSCKSDDSYDELFKSPRHNVIIEETQDPASQLPKSPSALTETIDADTEQQEKEEAFTEKCCDVEKDENLNVSAKVADTSANDSTVNFLRESDMQVDECETKETVTSSSLVTENIDEKPQAETSDKKEADEKLPEAKDTVTDAVVVAEDANITDSANCVEKAETETEKPTENDEKIPSSQPKVTKESQSCLKIGSSYKPRTSVELLYDGARKTTTDDDSESKPEIVEIDDDIEKSVLESSTEIIFDQAKNGENKPEVVNIDDSQEEDERIIPDRLDSNSEVTAMGKKTDANDTIYKSCYDSKSEFSYKSMSENKRESSVDSNAEINKLVNGSDESKRSDKTANVDSDTFSGYDTPPIVLSRDDSNNAITFSSRKLATKILSGSKDLDNIELISISDHEQDISNTDDGARKSDLIHNSALAKTVQVEKEIGMYVKLRCLLQIDENTKELLGKELHAVHCEPIMEATSIRQKNDDTGSSSLADISDNKETSPGSVNSNLQTFHLNPSRLSMMSSVSSSSSASSAASLAAKLALKESVLFSLPRGPAKHAKKMSQDVLTSMSEKQTLDETYERLTREWSNNRLLTTTVLNCANAELNALDTHNISNERLDDHHLQKMHSSTPEVEAEKIELSATPKSTKKSKSLKRPRSKMTRSRAHTNGESKSSANTPTTTVGSITEDGSTPPKKSKTETDTVSTASERAKLVISDSDVLANSSPLPIDDLIGKKVFAKWSDNNYYPGTVTDRVKTKYKVNFYDGENKILIPEFIIPIPKTIREGLSVYATTQTNDYGSCGIIVDVKSGKNSQEDDVRYTVETDEGERLYVQVKDIFLSADQAQVLKEEVDSENNKSLPNTPKHLGQVSLDNMVEGKRRSKRIGTPVFSTPKTKSVSNSSSSKTKLEPSVSVKTKKKQRGLSESESVSSDTNAEPVMQDEYVSLGAQEIITRSNYSTPKSRNASNSSFSKIKSEPSVSGMAAKMKKKRSAVPENESTSSDTNAEPVMQDEYTLWGLQKEIIDTPLKSNMKGPKHRVKGKFSKKMEVEDEETKQIYGPIPSNNTIFKGLSFIITCAPTDNLDRWNHDGKTSASGTETETENEAEWLKRPFVRERLQRQIIAGGGKVYDDFNEIPKEEYANTKHITNVPNTTAKSILCLSVGIPSYNHKWIIRCCLEEKLVNSAEEMLPTGWSLQRRTYVEAFQTKIKPLLQHVIIIPNQLIDQQFATFWSQVCDNAGAVVLVAESSENIEEMEFDSAAVIVSNQRCPSWAVEKAQQLRIPIMSATWVIQCLIEGRVCPYNQQTCYKYNYIKN